MYYALICDPVAGASYFVLNALRLLPHEDIVRSHWETLQRIETKLVEYSAPIEYLSAFRKIVHDNRKRAASEVRGGQIKRTAS
jgi:hypothetical protein